jgi:GH15 family glucan-1,4-alpha-glucosidase
MLLEEYGLIGDLESAALVSRNGSIDWLCLPRFDSASCFAALLADERHGRWLLTPSGEVRAIARRYRPGTLVLETEFETADGAVRVIDFMPRRGSGPPRVMRIVDGLPGDEGQFLACSFWLVNALARNGRVDEARALFERLIGLANDLGLLAEEYDVARRRQIGNFPQAFSHLTLILAARAMSTAGAKVEQAAA